MEPMTNSRIKSVVLQRARFVHSIRPLISDTLLVFVLMLISVYCISREVWVARVLENMPSPAHLAAFWRFVEAAFLNTSFAVQILSVLLVAGTIWVARSMAEKLRASPRYV